MKKKFMMLALAILFLTMGYSVLAEAQEKGGANPVITQTFAAKEIRSGETWKIYLNVSDPNGDMKNIYAVVSQPGGGSVSSEHHPGQGRKPEGVFRVHLSVDINPLVSGGLCQ